MTRVTVPAERREDVAAFVAELAVSRGLEDGFFQPALLHADDELVTLLRPVSTRQRARTNVNRQINKRGFGFGGLVVARDEDELVVYRSGAWQPGGRYEGDPSYWAMPSFRGSLADALATVKAAIVPRVSSRGRLSGLAERLAA